jgi:hypothetical protein
LKGLSFGIGVKTLLIGGVTGSLISLDYCSIISSSPFSPSSLSVDESKNTLYMPVILLVIELALLCLTSLFGV